MTADPPTPDEDWFRKSLRAVVSRYVEARTKERLDSSHPLWSVGKRIRQDLEAVPAVRDRKHLKVRWSFGQGVWARIPWIALLDARVTQATSSGVYVIYLFREDMTGLYATLNQGITKEKGRLGADAGRRVIRERAVELRSFAKPLERAGFILSNELDLKTDHSLGNDYQHGTIAHRLYESFALPETAVLLGDLQLLLEAYDAILTARLR